MKGEFYVEKKTYHEDEPYESVLPTNLKAAYKEKTDAEKQLLEKIERCPEPSIRLLYSLYGNDAKFDSSLPLCDLLAEQLKKSEANSLIFTEKQKQMKRIQHEIARLERFKEVINEYIQFKVTIVKVPKEDINKILKDKMKKIEESKKEEDVKVVFLMPGESYRPDLTKEEAKKAFQQEEFDKIANKYCAKYLEEIKKMENAFRAESLWYPQQIELYSNYRIFEAELEKCILYIIEKHNIPEYIESEPTKHELECISILGKPTINKIPLKEVSSFQTIITEWIEILKSLESYESKFVFKWKHSLKHKLQLPIEKEPLFNYVFKAMSVEVFGRLRELNKLFKKERTKLSADLFELKASYYKFLEGYLWFETVVLIDSRTKSIDEIIAMEKTLFARYQEKENGNIIMYECSDRYKEFKKNIYTNIDFLTISFKTRTIILDEAIQYTNKEYSKIENYIEELFEGAVKKNAAIKAKIEQKLSLFNSYNEPFSAFIIQSLKRLLLIMRKSE